MIRPTINIIGFTFLSVITIDSGAKDDKTLNSNPKEIFIEEIDVSKYYLLLKRKTEKEPMLNAFIIIRDTSEGTGLQKIIFMNNIRDTIIGYDIQSINNIRDTIIGYDIQHAAVLFIFWMRSFLRRRFLWIPI